MNRKTMFSLLSAAVLAAVIGSGMISNAIATAPVPAQREAFDVDLASRSKPAPAPAPAPAASGDATGSINRGAVTSHARPSRPDWRLVVEYLRARSTPDRMSLVNYFVNASVAYRTDMESLGVEDEWATPEQTWARGWGDCEDSAIAKYKLAQDAGVTSGLKLAYVLKVDLDRDEWLPHVVLLWYEYEGDRDPWVLDLSNSLARLSERGDLRVKTTFTEHGAWLQDRDITEPNLPKALALWPAVRDAMYPVKRLESRRVSGSPKAGSRGSRSQRMVGGYYM